jgi:hypothetical protein
MLARNPKNNPATIKVMKLATNNRFLLSTMAIFSLGRWML